MRRESAILYAVLVHALIAIGNLAVDYPLLSGPDGLLPDQAWFDSVRSEFSFINCVKFFPSLLFFVDPCFLLILGLLASLIGLCFVKKSTKISRFSCGIVYIVLLSFSHSQGVLLWFPWDCMLLELLFLCTVCPEKDWPFRFLMFRVMFGFGKHKFSGSDFHHDLLYTKTMACWQPLGTNIGWFMTFAPDILHIAAIVFTFLVEIICPFAFIVETRLRNLACTLTLLLMTFIQLSGHYGWFNTLTACLAFSLSLDKRPDTKRTNERASLVLALKKTMKVTYIVVSILFLIPSQWNSPGIFYHNSLSSEVFDIFRIASSWRIVHSYGVFPPKKMPMIKPVGRFQVTTVQGKEILLDYHYQVSRNTTDSGAWPFLVAPFRFPRFDYIHGFYAASHVWSLGTRLGPLHGTGEQYIDSVAKKLLEKPADSSLGLFKNDLTGLMIVKVEFQIVGLVPDFRGGWREASVDLDKQWTAIPEIASQSVTDGLPPSMMALRRKSSVFQRVFHLAESGNLEEEILGEFNSSEPFIVSQRFFDAAVALSDAISFQSEREWFEFVQFTYDTISSRGKKLKLVSDACQHGGAVWNLCHASKYGGFIGCLTFLHLVPVRLHSAMCPLILHSNRMRRSDSAAYRKIIVPDFIYTFLAIPLDP